MKKIFFIVLAGIGSGANAQEKTLPAEAQPFVMKGYEMLDYIKGDLNGDKRSDAILILKNIGEDTAVMDENIVRPFIILTRQANGKLKQEKRNDNLVLCRSCGGTLGDPYVNTSIIGNGFSIDFYGGSSWRWGDTYRFAWKPGKMNWCLVNEKQVSFQSGDPENTTKEVVIEEDELENLTIDDYGKNASSDYGKWKVTAAKTFFYDNPKLGSKPRKAYLLKDDNVKVLRVLKNFVEVGFNNSKGQFSNGFVLKKDLEKPN